MSERDNYRRLWGSHPPLSLPPRPAPETPPSGDRAASRDEGKLREEKQ